MAGLKFKINNFYFWFFFVLCSTIYSCGVKPIDELNSKINYAIRTQNNIDQSEWISLVAYIDSNKISFSDFLDKNQKVDDAKLTDKIIEVSSNRRNSEAPIIFEPKSIVANATIPSVKIFIENSGSMDGYVRGIRDFEIVIGKILVLSKDYCSQTKSNDFDVFFINKQPYPAPEIKELTDFARTLEPQKNSPYEKGDRSESILNDVLKIILDSTKQNTISILVSDCIYSLEPTKDTKGSLGYQQNGTMEVFLNKFRSNSNVNFTTCIYKMMSDYEGNYFPFNYDPKLKNSINLYNVKALRPYYIWVIGEHAQVTNFNKKINFKTLKGFQNSYTLLSYSKQNAPYYSMLKETNLIGSFKPSDRSAKELKSIEEIEYQNGTFQFSVAINLSDVPVDSNYLRDSSNYKTTKGFIIKSIEPIDRNKIKPRDLLAIEKTTSTHIITISTSNKFSIQDFKLELLNKLPEWVKLSTSMDDTNVKDELDKTFGLSYLIQGVSEAYSQNPEQQAYFNVTISIKK